jgi:6-phosphogluconolactonase
MHPNPRTEVSRRALLGGTWLAGAAILGSGTGVVDARSAAAPPPQTARKVAALYAYVGCYTSAKRYARGDGIHVYRVDPETGNWEAVQQLGNLVNPSFLAPSPVRPNLYSVHGDETYVTSFSIDPGSGRLTLLNRIESGGRNGVHLAVDPSGRFLLVANYGTGSVSVLQLRQDGSLGERTQLVALPGQPGPHRLEQTSSHPHQIVLDPSGRFAMVPDKGLDRVFMFTFDAAAGTLTPTVQGSATVRPGSGPRHAAFHPSLPVAWVLNEISSTVVTYYMEAERGGLRAAQILPTLPSDYTGENTGAEIAVSSGGRFVYCSNRGHDSIAIFSTDPATGLLTSVGWTPTQGRIPRFIGFDPSRRFLYAANEQADTVVTWSVDAATGRLTPTGQVVRTASPVTIAFAGF